MHRVWLRRSVLLSFVCISAGCLHQTSPEVIYPLRTLNCTPCPEGPFSASVIPASTESPATPVEMPIDFNTALRLADQNNPAIAVVRERIQQAVAMQQSAESKWLPDLEIGPNYTLHDGPIQETNGNVNTVHRSALFAGAGPSLVLNPGDAYYSNLAARQVTNAYQANANGITNETLLQVALVYVDVMQALGELEINKQTLANARLLVELTSSFERSGKGVAADTARARVEASTREREQFELLARLASTQARLAQLLRLSPEVSLKPAEQTIQKWELVTVNQPVQGLIATALLQRPELEENRAWIAASLERWRAAKVQPLLPTLRLGYSVGTFGGGPDDFVGNFGTRNDLTATLGWQMYGLGFGNQATIAERRSQYAQAVFQRDGLEARIAEQVVASYQELVNRSREFKPAREAVTNATESYRLNEERIRRAPEQGRPIELLQAIQALARARSDELALLSDYNRGQFRLFAALGFTLGCDQQAASPATPEPIVSIPAK
jgi:outer membrane protein TolC